MESLGRFAGGIAHDFNNLLAIILGNCELMQEGGDAEMPYGRTWSRLNPLQKGLQSLSLRY